MKVVEIFKSIEGEGIRTGYPAIFVRLAGCNLRCSYCDTKYSYNEEEAEELSIIDIYRKIYLLGGNRVTITGGEPLMHDNIYDMIKLLIDHGYEINIETNGSFPIEDFISKQTIITMDYKCAGSGMENEMLLDNISKLRNQDVLKFVVSDEADLDTVKNIYKTTKAQVFISPVFGRIEPKKIVEYVLEHGMDECRVQVQLHKIIWDVNQRGV